MAIFAYFHYMKYAQVGREAQKAKKCAYVIYEWSPRQVSAEEKAAFLAKKNAKVGKSSESAQARKLPALPHNQSQ